MTTAREMNQQVQSLIYQFRSDPSENAMHSLIEIGTSALPDIVDAWRREPNPSLRNRLFEVLAEMPCEETVPILQQKLSSLEQDEVQFAALGLFRFDALRFATQILSAI